MNRLKNKFLLGGMLLLLIVGLPAIVFLSQQKQENRSRASASTTLYFAPSTSPASPAQKQPGDTVAFDVMISPGTNRPSIIKLELDYDPTKLQPTSSPFIVNTAAFPETREGPFVQNNSVLISVSVGSDPSKAISQVTKVGTVYFTAVGNTTTPTVVSFGQATTVLSVASTDQATENVLSTTSPAYLTIAYAPTPTPTLTPTPTPTPGPSTSSLSCSPATATLSNQGVTLFATLQNSSGVTIVGKPITWTSSNPAVTITPTSSLTNSLGTASTGAIASGASAFSATITASFAGDSSSSPSSCTIQATYTPPVQPTSTPTPTPAPTVAGSTKLGFNVFMHGIGNSGDNSNPTSYSLSNKTPLNSSRNVQVQVLDGANNVVTTANGTIAYDATSGTFKGTVDLGSGLTANGAYNVKVKEATHLRRLVPGIQNLVVGQTQSLGDITLIAGDINNDNAINILDYNELISCYSDLAPAAFCPADYKTASDLNDNGQVNQFDYNLFLREITVQSGQ